MLVVRRVDFASQLPTNNIKPLVTPDTASREFQGRSVRPQMPEIRDPVFFTAASAGADSAPDSRYRPLTAARRTEPSGSAKACWTAGTPSFKSNAVRALTHSWRTWADGS